MLSVQTAVIHTLGSSTVCTAYGGSYAVYTDCNGTTLGSYAVYTDCNGTHPG